MIILRRDEIEIAATGMYIKAVMIHHHQRTISIHTVVVVIIIIIIIVIIIVVVIIITGMRVAIHNDLNRLAQCQIPTIRIGKLFD